jgi:hypothetical protein
MKEVSLGFAEFVSQLIQETFDAILSSQNYQLEKYAELESKLNMANNVYLKNYISEDQIEERKLDYFGFKVEKQMVISEAFNQFINENFESEKKLVHNNKLTILGYDIIHEFISNLIVEEQKGVINTIINKSNSTNLVVDSGEITAKLELSNLYTQEEETDADVKADMDAGSRLKNVDFGKPTRTEKEVLLPSFNRKIKVIDHVDVSTGKSTILIDKSTVDTITDSNVLIPNVRLSVQPTKMSSSSNLYSEIKLSFKTV